MGDHLALLVDHLLTESTLDAVIGGGWKIGSARVGNSASLDQSVVEINDTKDTEPQKTLAGKLVECRICQEEDQESNMEVPCSCCGSLKYAHRRCVQKWCNEKGDIVCEICLQQFMPGYAAPPKLLPYESIPMSLRQDTHDGRIISLLPVDHDLVHSDDHYSTARMRSTVCFRSVAFMFMLLLTLRHVVPLIVGSGQYSLALFSVRLYLLLALRSAGILISILVMVRLLITIKQRLHGQIVLPHLAISSSEGESGTSVGYLHNTRSPQLHVIQVQ